jgi:GAF domain-containing protein
MSVEELPIEANAEKEILEPQGIKSLIVVPMIYSNKVIGYTWV